MSSVRRAVWLIGIALGGCAAPVVSVSPDAGGHLHDAAASVANVDGSVRPSDAASVVIDQAIAQSSMDLSIVADLVTRPPDLAHTTPPPDLSVARSPDLATTVDPKCLCMTKCIVSCMAGCCVEDFLAGTCLPDINCP